MIEELTYWDFPDTKLVPEGYDMTEIPELTIANFHVLIEEHNKLVRIINEMRGEKK